MAHKDFDCIIVGAGCAGCTLSKKLAEAGFSVCLIEKVPTSEAGYLWEVIIEKQVFGKIGMKLPDKIYWEEGPDKSRYYATNIHNHIEIDLSHDEGMYIKHRKINSLLLAMALKAGVKLKDNHIAKELLIEKNHVAGVKGERKSLMGWRTFSIRAKVTIDASGISAVLRRQTPVFFEIKHSLRQQDYALAWQEVREVDSENIERLEKSMNLLPGISYIKMGKYHGYEVFHLRKNNTVNLIFGTSYNGDKTGAKKACEKFVVENPFFGKRVYGGGQLIPIRRAIDSMVGDGFICIGDSACQGIPTMGSGVASSMQAANIAFLTITDAFNSENFSREKLWSYNHEYQSERGAILASYDIIRRFLQSLSSEEINEVFKAGLLRNETFLSTFSSNIIKFDALRVIEDLGKLFSHISLIQVGMRFLQALSDSKRALSIYKKYPEIYNTKSFKRWVDETNRLFSHYRTYSSPEEESFI